jgi:hypothetical protein
MVKKKKSKGGLSTGAALGLGGLGLGALGTGLYFGLMPKNNVPVTKIAWTKDKKVWAEMIIEEGELKNFIFYGSSGSINMTAKNPPPPEFHEKFEHMRVNPVLWETIIWQENGIRYITQWDEVENLLTKIPFDKNKTMIIAAVGPVSFSQRRRSRKSRRMKRKSRKRSSRSQKTRRRRKSKSR